MTSVYACLTSLMLLQTELGSIPSPSKDPCIHSSCTNTTARRGVPDWRRRPAWLQSFVLLKASDCFSIKILEISPQTGAARSGGGAAPLQGFLGDQQRGLSITQSTVEHRQRSTCAF